MAGKYGYLKEFIPEKDSIGAYLERAALYFKANGIEEDKQVPILLSSIGSRSYSLLRDLVAPVVPGTEAFDWISEVFTSHFQPRHLLIAERFHFHRCVQAVVENIAEFDAALWNLGTYCEFEEMLVETLYHRFVCVLRNEATEGKLLTEHDFMYQKALEISKGMEAAESKSISLKTRGPSVNKVLHRESPGT